MKNFNVLDSQEIFDNVVRIGRTITGRLTKRRYEILKAYTKRYTDTAPYGRSERGYAYTCGCDHDCCGHLTRQSMDMDIRQIDNGHQICIVFSQSYNF